MKFQINNINMDEYYPYPRRNIEYDPISYVEQNRPRKSGGPISGHRSNAGTASGAREPAIRIYVTLKKEYEGLDDYKKLSIMSNNSMLISELKRKIEKEFVDLFPSEPPYIVAKLEDEKGFSLSNNSLIGEFLMHGDRVYAQPEGISEIRSGPGGDQVKGLHGGGNSQDLLDMLKNLQSSVLAKLAASDLHMHEDVEDLLNNVIWLGFSMNSTIIHNVWMIMSKILTPFTVQIYDKESNKNLQDLTILLIQYWLNEMWSSDTYLMTHTILIIENLIICPAMWDMLKGSPIIARLLSLSKSSSATGETKSKIIRIVTSLSKESAPPPPPENKVSKKAKYDNVNIRLYQDGNDGLPPYIPSSAKRIIKVEKPDVNAYSFDAGRRRSSQMKEYGRESLRKVGYDAIHSRGNDKPSDFNLYEEVKGVSRTVKSKGERPMASYTEKLNKNMFDMRDNYEEEYQFPLDGGARRDPIVKIPLNDNLLHDYWWMLDKDNNRDINMFAIQSLEPLIKDTARIIINDAEKFLWTFNLIEMFTMPFEIQEMQFKIIDTLTDYINESAAKEWINANGISRIMKAYNYHAPNYQSSVAAFWYAICTKGLKYLDIPTVISLSLCPYPSLQNIGIRTLSVLSDNAADGDKSLDSEFENHIPFLFEAYNSSKNMSSDAKNHLLQTLANLAIRDYLRPIIIDHKGLKVFLDALRDGRNIEGQRISAKGLVNLTAGKRDIQL